MKIQLHRGYLDPLFSRTCQENDGTQISIMRLNVHYSLVDADGNERHVRVFENASDPHFCGKDSLIFIL